MDKISTDRAKLLHPKVRDEVLEIMAALDKRQVTIRITQGLRSFAEQDALYAMGRTARSNVGITAEHPLGAIVTNARGGQSYHNYGLAVDFCLVHADRSVSFKMTEDLDADGRADWLEVVEEFEKAGWSWGGLWKFPDTPHFEKTFGYNFKQLFQMKGSNDYPAIPGL